MNIISNNCVGGAIYQELNIPYNNPFMWCFITGDNFYTLIKEFDNINFNHYKILDSCLDKEVSEYKNTYSLYVDNKIYIHYIHYIHDINFDNPTKKSDITGKYSRDLLYKNADILCIEKYNNRLSRMKEKPIFVISLTKYLGFEDIRKCMYLNSKYKRIFLIPSNFDYDKNKLDKNCEVIIQPENGVKWSPEKAKYILNNSKILNKVKTIYKYQ